MEIVNRPLVSFCIPTYNRATYLETTLKSYISCKSFDKNVELVISDNHSTDNTQSICEEYAQKYSNIKYFRNDENIYDANFPLALNRASGHYIKLMNDNIHITENGLSALVSFIDSMKNERPPIFCCTRYFNHPQKDVIICNNANEFIRIVSRSCTAIGMFGAWKEDWDCVIDPLKYSKLQLSQVDWCYQIINLRKKAILYTKPYSTKRIDMGLRRGGYNWFEVQVHNYYAILQPYIDNNLISKYALREEKATFLKNIMPWIATRYWLPMYREWQFEWKGSTKYLWDAFKSLPLFYLIMGTLPIWANYYFFKYYIRSLFVKIGIIVR